VIDPGNIDPSKSYVVRGSTLRDLLRRAKRPVAGTGLDAIETPDSIILSLSRAYNDHPFRVRIADSETPRVAVYEGHVKTGAYLLSPEVDETSREAELDVSATGHVCLRLDFSGAWPGTPTPSLEFIAGETYTSEDTNDTARIPLAKVTLTDGKIADPPVQIVRGNLLHYRTVVWYSYPERIIHDWGFS